VHAKSYWAISFLDHRNVTYKRVHRQSWSSVDRVRRSRIDTGTYIEVVASATGSTNKASRGAAGFKNGGRPEGGMGEMGGPVLNERI